MGNNNDVLKDLMKGTDFQIISTVEDNSNKSKVTTPLDILNIIFGGGIPFGTIFQAYGLPKCFLGSTKIFTTKGSKTLKELYDSGEGFSVYSKDLNSGELCTQKAESVMQDREVNELVELEIDDQHTIQSTTDHPYLTTSGSYIEAKDLHPGTELESIHVHYETDSNGCTSKDPCRVTGMRVIELDNPEKVYGVYNVESTHNYTIDLGDGTGILVSNSGKSTIAYQTMANFQAEYPNGISIIIDTESSADGARLEYLGLDIGNTLRLPSTDIESGFLMLLKFLENKEKEKSLKDVPVFVIWDTISKGLATPESTQSRLNAMDRARIIKNYMSPVMAKIEKHDFILCLLNQVIYTSDRYGNVKTDSGGGISIKHDIHVSMFIEKSWDIDEGNLLKGRMSHIKLDKSKISPEISQVSLMIDATQGGAIDSAYSFVQYLLDVGWVAQGGGWYKFDPVLELFEGDEFIHLIEKYQKSYRWDDLVNTVRDNDDLYTTLKYYYAIYYSSIYELQKLVMEDYIQSMRSHLLTNYVPTLPLEDSPEDDTENTTAED